MRPLEILLLLVNLLVYLVLALPRLGALRRVRGAAAAAPVTAAAQVLAEGLRWQMIPAYALSVILFLVSLLWRKPADDPGRGRTSQVTAGVSAGLGALGLAISSLLPVIAPVFRFPPPSGPYAIGTLTYHWVDANRPEIFTADPDAPRELMVQVWYPAQAAPSAPRAPWVQDADTLAPTLARLLRLPGFALGHLKYITSNAVPSAPVAEDAARYPVLIFSHGTLGFRQHNTFQVEELVSHGYIVAAIDQPYTAAIVVFPDGRQVDAMTREQLVPLVHQSYSPSENVPVLNGQPLDKGIIPYLAQDVVFTLDQLAALNQADPNGILTGRLDMDRIGFFGTSQGGIVGAEACRIDPRLRACLLMDAPMPTEVVREGLHQPLMLITRDADTMRLERERAGGWPETEIEDHLTTMRAVFDSLPGDGYYVEIPGMFHLDTTDTPMLTPLGSRLGLSGTVGQRRVHDLINAYSLAFFDRHLMGLPATLLDGPSTQYPEVSLETRRS